MLESMAGVQQEPRAGRGAWKAGWSSESLGSDSHSWEP